MLTSHHLRDAFADMSRWYASVGSRWYVLSLLRRRFVMLSH